LARGMAFGCWKKRMEEKGKEFEKYFECIFWGQQVLFKRRRTLFFTLRLCRTNLMVWSGTPFWFQASSQGAAKWLVL
jgi:hypothetical protein